jgi:hypothetical protein
VLIGRRSCHGYGSRIVLVESQGNRAFAQEGPS